MLTAGDLRACARALESLALEQDAAAEAARRADPRDAHEAEDAAAELRAIASRVAAAAEVQGAYEARLAIAAAEADSQACHRCGGRPVVDHVRGLCAPCAIEGERPQ